MKKYMYLLIVLFCISCKNDDEKIVLTCGLGENPDSPRFGIEINNSGDVFYCEEIKNKIGEYKYYQSKLRDETKFNDLKSLIRNDFKTKKIQNKNTGTRFYNLKMIDESSSVDVFFAFNSLDSNQVVLINKIVSLKNQKMKKIKYHDFPNKLLIYKLPVPEKKN